MNLKQKSENSRKLTWSKITVILSEIILLLVFADNLINFDNPSPQYTPENMFALTPMFFTTVFFFGATYLSLKKWPFHLKFTLPAEIVQFALNFGSYTFYLRKYRLAGIEPSYSLWELNNFHTLQVFGVIRVVIIGIPILIRLIGYLSRTDKKTSYDEEVHESCGFPSASSDLDRGVTDHVVEKRG